MVFPIRTPRVNNNDDTVLLSAVFAQPGALVREGEKVAEIETDKATFTVEAERQGYFLKCLRTVGDTIAVGSILAWMGETADDKAPEEAADGASTRRLAEPTLKAAMLLTQYDISADQVPSSSDRLSVADVEAYISTHALTPGTKREVAAAAPPPVKQAVPPPEVPANIEDLSVIERGMLRTVSWHRAEAVPGYIEVVSNAKAWEEYGAAFQKAHKLLLNPMLALMAYRLVALREKNPKYNATVYGGRKYLYQPVNVGFTVQSGDHLYLIVAAGAERMSAREFVSRLFDLQKAAMKNRLEASETSGATIGFASMARWGVVRHQPVLAPYTSLMVAHAAPADGQSVLGATYDHRLLSGADVVAALNFLKEPPEAETEP